MVGLNRRVADLGVIEIRGAANGIAECRVLGLIDYGTVVQVNLAAVAQGRKVHRAVLHQITAYFSRSLPAKRSRILYLKLGKSDGAVSVIHQFWKHLAENWRPVGFANSVSLSCRRSDAL